jgi:release factor glutamine methyltransferase
LDIGTGSGCIAISLAKHLPKAKIFGLDVSNEALNIANQNAELNAVEVEFIKANILEQPTFKTHFDIIVSNPPYIREKEKELMKANVLMNEPHLALFVIDENPLLFYRAISKFAVNNLSKKGLLFFEINEYLGNNMIALLNDNDFGTIELKQDIFKKDRMIKGVKN